MAESKGGSSSKTFIDNDQNNDNSNQSHASTLPYHSTLSMDGRNNKTVDPERGERGARALSFWGYLQTDVDPAWSTAPLAAFCFMTGYMYAISLFEQGYNLSFC